MKNMHLLLFLVQWKVCYTNNLISSLCSGGRELDTGSTWICILFYTFYFGIFSVFSITKKTITKKQKTPLTIKTKLSVSRWR